MGLFDSSHITQPQSQSTTDSIAHNCITRSRWSISINEIQLPIFLWTMQPTNYPNERIWEWDTQLNERFNNDRYALWHCTMQLWAMLSHTNHEAQPRRTSQNCIISNDNSSQVSYDPRSYGCNFWYWREAWKRLCSCLRAQQQLTSFCQKR